MIYSKKDFDLSPQALWEYYPNLDFIDAISKRTCRPNIQTAAVVFNSGLENLRSCGDAIDACDLVIRINFQPTQGHEEHVGSVTTIRVLGRKWIYQEKNEILAHSYNNAKYAEADLHNLRRSPRLREAGIYVTRDSELQSQWRPLLGGMMSNGFRAVLLGLSLAEQVIIFGADLRNCSVFRWHHRKDQAAEHFPGPQHLPSIKDSLKDWDIQQNFEWYFEPLERPERFLYRPHKSVFVEYAFYKANPRVSFY